MHALLYSISVHSLDGGNYEENSSAVYPGAEYVNANTMLPSRMEQGNLPVAQPIEATVVSAASYDYNQKATAPVKGQQYTKTTTVTHIPAPSQQQQPVMMNNQGNFRNARETYMPSFRRSPTILGACPNCNAANIRTRIRTYPSIFTWIFCLVLLLLFWPLCWVPLVCDVFKQTDHFCTTCNTKVGETHPFSDCCEKQRG